MIEVISSLLLLVSLGFVYLLIKNSRLQVESDEQEKKLQRLEYVHALNSEIEKLARIGFWEIDLKNGEVYWSDNMHDVMFGLEERPTNLSKNEVIANVVHPDYIDNMNTKIKNCVEGKSAHYEIEYYTNTGRWHHGRGGLIKDSKTQTPTHLVGIVVDVTKEKQIQAEAIEAKLQVEKANQTKNVFLQNMSHETRTPINVILGCLQLLKNDPTADCKENTELAIASANSLLTQINDIISLCKTDSKNIVIEATDICVDTIVNAVIKSMKFFADTKTIPLLARIDTTVPQTVKIDPVRVRQVLTNLVSNAIKFTSVGSVELRVSVQENKLVFSVIDSGIGIDESNHGMIFDPFTQVDDSITRKYEGSGLGLATCKNLAQLMNGSLTVNSRLGSGAEFVFAIPLVSGEGRKKSLPSFDDNLTEKLSNDTILVVEDNAINQKILKSYLQRAGCKNIEIANNGKKAIDMITNINGNQIDFVLMDMMMPVMGGVEATKQIRKLEADQTPIRTKPNVPIICITANATKGTQEVVLASGFNHYLTKPIIFSELTAILSESKI